MSLMMMLAMGSKPPYVPTLRSKTFLGNETFIVPVGVSRLETAEGHGSQVKYYTHVVDILYRRDFGIDYVETDVDGWNIGNSISFTDHCDPVVFERAPEDGGSTVYAKTQRCYYYRKTGAPATGFGKVFNGWTGSQPVTYGFQNVPVTAGAGYAVVVPAGGVITITWME